MPAKFFPCLTKPVSKRQCSWLQNCIYASESRGLHFKEGKIATTKKLAKAKKLVKGKKLEKKQTLTVSGISITKHVDGASPKL